jgi:hypothetical protein
MMELMRDCGRMAGMYAGHVMTERANRLSLVVVLLLHVGATCLFFPPWEALRQEPLYAVDYPVHTHRVYVYRQAFLESGLPWGYDPAVSAGTVMNPGYDLGAKAQQILGLLLPFLSPGAIVRLFLFIVVLTFPLWTLLACQLLRIPGDAQVCVMVSLLAPGWLLQQLNIFFYTGVVGFVAASYFSIYVLALFISLLSNPRLQTYVAFCVAGAVLFLLHFLGPLVLIPPMVFYSLAWRPLSWRWRIAVWLAPLAIVSMNAFWVLPYLLHWEMPFAGWPRIPALINPDRHLTYDSWSDLFERVFRPLWLGPQIVGVALALYGFVLLRKFVDRPVVVSFVLVAVSALLLTYFGSFLPVAGRLQPVRFVVVAFVFLTVPVGIAVATLMKKLGLPAGVSMAGSAVLLAIPTIWLGVLKSLPLPPSPDSLAEFVAQQTAPTDRLLIQSADGYRNGGFESKIFPLRFEREVIGSNYSAVTDPAQFLDKVLLGRELNHWSKDELKAALERWGVTWIFTVTPEGHQLLTDAFGAPAAEVGNYRAFRMRPAPTRFLVGQGLIGAHVNRLELKQLRSQNGFVVIRYRYHPAWQPTPDVPIYPYPIPEDPYGFIAIKDPPESVTLRFDPLAMVHAKWPQKNPNPAELISSEEVQAGGSLKEVPKLRGSR